MPRLSPRFLLLAVAFTGALAHAQLVRLPQVTLPSLPPRPDVQLPSRETLPVRLPEEAHRAARILDLRRQRPDVIELDPRGNAIRRAELLWLSPAPQALARARQAGFVVLQDTTLAELDVREVLLRAPGGLGTGDAAEQLRALDPQAPVDFNHLYVPGASGTGTGDAQLAPASGAGGALRIGLIDSGVDAQHPALRSSSVQAWGCDGRRVPADHGTAVASLLAGLQGGVQPGAALLAADVYCGDPAGASAEAVARAIAWLLRERVPVVNISLVGPPNRLLELAVAAAVRRGHLLVAAVGNDGPAAAPLYPAAYAGVVAVTAVNAAHRALPEAGQGVHVAFAARGDLLAAKPGGGLAPVRGTSYATPIVAGRLAALLREPSPDAASAAVVGLAREAIDLGARGRDPVFGFGLVGDSTGVASP
ncbi:S8 family serine peptidase [Ramlibacter algicola]|uniref:S8 family serine peptidase n=1 Tax=Ramlibacter algicola TaxID=2795217 RepID=A0A934USF8_9BURK|nr:S8 family serine peptidase [Ramlibacter algicola]MBK0393698.1 S8 family serine peptidase [Ramlibacter algicola]